MPWIICGLCIGIALLCIFKLQRKQYLDKTEKFQLEKQIELLKHNRETLQDDIKFCEEQIDKDQQRLKSVLSENQRILAQKAIEVDEFYDKAKARRMEQLENEMMRQEDNAKALLSANLQRETDKFQEQINTIEKTYNDTVVDYNLRTKKIEDETRAQEERFNSLLAPLQQYEKEKQDKLFYTIQIPEEYHNDIDYLLTTVSQQIQHPDIVNKLVWSEYVKPYLDDTFKRVGIEAKSGIYKITNIETNKAYIGKSTDIKKRISDHLKGSCGIKSIADQAIHHAMLKEGLWNWSVEYITYCEKEQLSELEKYYIEFFKTTTYGFNKNSGGGG